MARALQRIWQSNCDPYLMTQAPLTPVINFLKRHAPFDQMTSAHLEYMAKRLKLVFYRRGETILRPEDGPASRFFVIKQGRVRGEVEGDETHEGAWELVSGECFPIGALLSRRATHVTTTAIEDTFCYELTRDEFDRLLVKSPIFQDFCTRRLASLLDSALRTVQANSAARMSEDTSLSTALQGLIRRQPVACGPDAPLHEALQRMQEERVGSIIIIDSNRVPLGVFTLHDVLSRVTLPETDLSLPVGEVMTPDPIALPPTARAYEAALMMAQAGFGHLCVVENRQLIGVLSERDLFSLQRVGLVSLSRSIADARDVATLARLGQDVHRLVDQMLAQGASVDQLTQIITALNDSLTRRVIKLVEHDAGLPTVGFTWLSFGSEGRHEQTLKTDQDNGILFSLPEGRTADSVREELLPLAEQINNALAECGFPLCPGNIMASNPECCLSLDEWKGRFGRWIDQGTPEHLLNASIFFDFRPLRGDPEATRELRQWVLDRVEKNSRFRRQMAANALRNRPPLGLFRDFVVTSGGEHPHTVNLKVQGITPFVDAARIYALAHHVEATSTGGRLEGGVREGVFKRTDVDAWMEAYHFIQLLRMRSHRQQAEEGEPLSNHIDPDTLNELDRRILKEAFRQARKLQSKLALEYQL